MAPKFKVGDRVCLEGGCCGTVTEVVTGATVYTVEEDGWNSQTAYVRKGVLEDTLSAMPGNVMTPEQIGKLSLEDIRNMPVKDFQANKDAILAAMGMAGMEMDG